MKLILFNQQWWWYCAPGDLPRHPTGDGEEGLDRSGPWEGGHCDDGGHGHGQDDIIFWSRSLESPF